MSGKAVILKDVEARGEWNLRMTLMRVRIVSVKNAPKRQRKRSAGIFENKGGKDGSSSSSSS
eukprot:CAMPEP_0201498580 /NCGR_PEP_ID=MMETSP0151_2-20130828/71921_1 /ASSEMBLY_ACC=CAM_ASM_000257 /TAXON_ID=200890 /ORGANISM="Paramoeba atlantica, Strain 621/1 / CCAP 1560/9" /LENGTH=61 /DNA_ID=CAMNT_0047890269 /DNA_START=255 /DNA_END=436 /DNA_ORIENTATION=+